MKFTTPVSIAPQEPRIDHHSKILLAGSCFVENIGDKFDYFKLPNKRNPFGILYHPFGIRDLISRAVSGSTFTKEDVFFHNERWHCFEAHSSLSEPDRENLISRLNEELVATRQYLKEATHVIITPGTSWIYRRVENNEPVANCHKLPQVNFKKEISSVAEIEEAMNTIVTQIGEINPAARIIFTISPVRHIKDGLVENQLSKSLLFVAIHNTVARHKLTSYFPSYEILMDELRDYRFYAEDMLHPGKVGVDFIWEKFVNTWFSPYAIQMLKEIDNIRKGLSHRPFHGESAAHQKFQMELQRKISNVKDKYPNLNFS
ncbi:MAG TPA: GSCFA domain-containing protein [Gillisia sp.]|nr:GSCFA domain-containing protein [Gillisia sp.]